MRSSVRWDMAEETRPAAAYSVYVISSPRPSRTPVGSSLVCAEPARAGSAEPELVGRRSTSRCPPGQPNGDVPAGVSVLWLDQALADRSSVIVHPSIVPVSYGSPITSLDSPAQPYATPSDTGGPPARALLLKHQTMLTLHERHRTGFSARG
jgi:hypothetical protein